MFTLSIKDFFWISSQGYTIHKRFVYFVFLVSYNDCYDCNATDASIWQQASGTKKIIPSQTLLPYPNPRDFFPSLQNERNVNMESTWLANAAATQPQPRFGGRGGGGSDETWIGHTLFQPLCVFVVDFSNASNHFFESAFLFTESPIN